MKPGYRSPPRRDVDAAAIIDALRKGGSADVAAQLLELKLGTFYQRAVRYGVNVRDTLHELRQERIEAIAEAGLQAAEAQIGADGMIRLSLSDYAILRAQALSWQTELVKADRIIASLTRALEALGGHEHGAGATEHQTRRDVQGLSGADRVVSHEGRQAAALQRGRGAA